MNLKGETDMLSRNVGKEIHCTLRSTLEELSSQPIRGGSMKPRKSEKVRDQAVSLQIMLSYDRKSCT